MNKEELQKKIAEYYQKLPQGAQRVFAEMRWLADLRAISQKYGLDDTQTETLSIETTLVLLGVIHLDEYENILGRELGLGMTRADDLIAEIDEKILRNIRGELNTSYDNNLADLFEQENKKQNNGNNQNQPENKTAVKIETKMNSKFSGLPANVLEAVKNSNYQDELYKIAEESDLSIEQMGILEETIAESFLGEIPSSDFGKIIKSRLSLPDEKVDLLVSQINEKILKGIRRKIMGENNTTNKIETPVKIDEAEKSVMASVGFNLSENKEDKSRKLNANDYKESYMQKAGITLEKEKIIEPKKEMPENSAEVMQKVGIKVVDVPAPETPKNIFAQKLGAEVKSTTKESDHSFKNLSNNNTTGNYTQNIDPYRMPIE